MTSIMPSVADANHAAEGVMQTFPKGLQSQIPEDVRQIPQHIGSMASNPVFCFKGCFQPLTDWANERVEFIADEMSKRHPRPVAVFDAAPFNDAKWGFVRTGLSIPARATLVRQVAASRQDASTATGGQAAPRQPINLDVFYCAGDALESQRRDEARAFAEATRNSAPHDFTLSGTFIDQIRLRSLDINVNLAMTKPKTGTSLVLVRSNPASPAWLARLSSRFDRTYSDNVTEKYFRAYFCDGFTRAQKPRPLVYTQVSYENQVPQAKQYLASLSSSLPELKFAQGIEAVDDTHPGKTHTPNQTQVRCYSSEQCKQADELARFLRPQVVKPVMVVRMTAPGTVAIKNPVIELWFGRDEMANWLPNVRP